MKKITGFTIIELVVVITILGILAAVALPKFFDITVNAGNAAAQGVAGGLASGSAVNYGARLAQGNTTGITLFTAGDICANTTALGSLLTGGLPTGYTIAAAGTCNATVNGNTCICNVTNTNVTGTTAQPATIIAVIN